MQTPKQKGIRLTLWLASLTLTTHLSLLIVNLTLQGNPKTLVTGLQNELGTLLALPLTYMALRLALKPNGTTNPLSKKP